jgi:prepilin-type N-terminal cleavage/methylation domain-containing protein
VRAGPRAGDRDAGFSLTEVIVSMSILSVVMVVAIGSIIQIYQAVNRVDNTSVARDQLSNSFRRLDKELRYATWVSTPGQVGGVWYLEYALPTACRQLALSQGRLTLATWPLATANPRPILDDPNNKPGVIGSDLSLVGTTPPFTVYPVGAYPYASASPGSAGVGKLFAPEHTQVRIQLIARNGRTSLPYDTVFTAQNTNGNTSALNDCSKGRPTS